LTYSLVNANVKLLKKCIYAQVYLSCPEPVFGAITHPVPTTYAYLTTISLSAILDLEAYPPGIHIHQGLSLSFSGRQSEILLFQRKARSGLGVSLRCCWRKFTPGRDEINIEF
jgi:hypothetical protein